MYRFNWDAEWVYINQKGDDPYASLLITWFGQVVFDLGQYLLFRSLFRGCKWENSGRFILRKGALLMAFKTKPVSVLWEGL
jgi:hypothetical protein